MHARITVFALLTAFFFISAPSQVVASYYRYTDDNGQMNVTNELDSVPQRYRASMTVVTEKQLEQKAAAREKRYNKESRERTNSTQKQIVAPAQNFVEPSHVQKSAEETTVSVPPERPQGWFARQLPFLKLIAIAIGAIGAVVIASRIAGSLAPRPLAIIIRVALCAALIIYLVKGYASKVTEAFARIKSEGAVAQKAVDKRSEKIDRQAQ